MAKGVWALSHMSMLAVYPKPWALKWGCPALADIPAWQDFAQEFVVCLWEFVAMLDKMAWLAFDILRIGELHATCFSTLSGCSLLLLGVS